MPRTPPPSPARIAAIAADHRVLAAKAVLADLDAEADALPAAFAAGKIDRQGWLCRLTYIQETLYPRAQDAALAAVRAVPEPVAAVPALRMAA